MMPFLVDKSVPSHEQDIPTDPQDLQAFAQQIKADYLALQAFCKQARSAAIMTFPINNLKKISAPSPKHKKMP